MTDEDAPREEPASTPPPLRYDQAFFLDLAAQGKEVWNAWRRDRANAATRVTFAGVDFSQAPLDEIDFAGFEFGDWADFSKCTWRGVAWSEIRDDPAAFKPGRASFAGATFGDFASLDGATFGDFASFEGATFGDDAGFEGATFGDHAHFAGATFGRWARFAGATFGDGLSFAHAVFNGRVTFAGQSTEQWTSDFERRIEAADEEDRNALERLKKAHEELRRRTGSGPNKFHAVSFSGAAFHGTAILAHRSFDRDADFTNTRFYRPPDVSGATNVGRVDLTGATIQFVGPNWPWWKPHWTDDPAIAVRLRLIRKVAEETKNHDLERDLYIEERKAERGAKLLPLRQHAASAAIRLFKASLVMLRHPWPARPAMLAWSDPPRVALRRAWRERARCLIVACGRLASQLLWIGVMAAYWALADYGRSVVRPAVWLGVSWLVFRWCYEGVFAPVLQKAMAAHRLDKAQIANYHHAVHMMAAGHAVPFVGALTIGWNIKKFLFCARIKDCVPIPPPGFQGLVITQNLVSILLVFFIGLALRNYFRIK